MLGHKLKPRWQKFEAPFNESPTEHRTAMKLVYEDSQIPAVETIETPFDDIMAAPGWRSPPDYSVSYVHENYAETLENGWTRSGPTFTKALAGNDQISAVDYVYYVHCVNGCRSVKSVKVVNPYSSTMAVAIFLGTAFDTGAVAAAEFRVRPNSSLTIPVVALIAAGSAINSAATFLSIRQYVYSKDIVDNSIAFSGTTFRLVWADILPDSQVVYGPGIAFDFNNVIDRYGLVMALLSGAFTGLELTYQGLKDSPVVQSAARKLGISLAQLVGIWSIGLFEGWLDMTDIGEMVSAETFALFAAPQAIGWLLGRLPDKYASGVTGVATSVAAGAAGAAVAAGSTLALLMMIDDIEVAMVH